MGRKLTEIDIDLIVMEILLTQISGLLTIFKGLVDYNIFLDLNLSLGDDCILDHLAAEFQVLLGCLASDVLELFFMVLHVVVEILLLLLLSILLFERHTLVKLRPAEACRGTSIETGLLQSLENEVVHLKSQRLSAGDKSKGTCQTLNDVLRGLRNTITIVVIGEILEYQLLGRD